jgi:nucleoside-diphosphate-sugar epimerase
MMEIIPGETILITGGAGMVGQAAARRPGSSVGLIATAASRSLSPRERLLALRPLCDGSGL